MTGLKSWAGATCDGYRIVSYLDAGFGGDPKLASWADDRLGRINGMVLFVLLEACPTFGE